MFQIMLIIKGGVQWRNVACLRPSAVTADSAPLFGAPPPLKVEGKIGQFKLF